MSIVQLNVLDPAVRWNPHPIYAAMRAESPIVRMPFAEMGSYPWLLTRYNDCVALLNDDRFSKDFAKLDKTGTYRTSAAGMINRHMLTVDPPDHTRLRGLVHKAFTPRIIQALSGRIQEIADELLSAMAKKSSIDLIADFAFPLPITVIAELLGVPKSDRDRFRHWSQTIVIGGVRGENMDEVATAAMEFLFYFQNLFDERRATPGDDLISGLVQVEEAGDKLDPQELISMVFLLLVAGHETTVNLIGNGTLALLTHPDQRALLRQNPDLIKSAVEEMLRYEGPVGASSMRWALRDMVLHGQIIHEGDMVLASLLSADRDPEVFADPDRFDITRTPNRHIAFGNGIHYCLGAPLARLEGAIAINALVQRYPGLGLDVEVSDIEWTETLLLRGMKHLPVHI